MFVPDKARAFGEAWRVLKPGGTFLFNPWDSLANNPLPGVVNQVVVGFFPENPPLFIQLPHSFFDQSTIRGLLDGVGFDEVSVELVTKQAQSTSLAEVARRFLEGTPLATLLHERASDRLADLREATTRALADRFGAGPMRAWVVAARKPTTLKIT